MELYNNIKSTEVIGNNTLVTSSYFKDLISKEFVTLEGAFLTYQIGNNKIYTGTDGPQSDVGSPEDNDFYFNTDTKEELIYNGEWSLLTTPLLDLIVETGFSADWIPTNTLWKNNTLQILIPSGYLPVNFSESTYMFIGFKNLVTNKIISSIGIPLNNTIDINDNTSIQLKIDFRCGLININEDKDIKTLEGESFDTSQVEEAYTIHNFLSEYNSNTSDTSSAGSGNMLGTSLNFN